MLGALLFKEEGEGRGKEINEEPLMIWLSEWFQVLSIQSGHVIFSDALRCGSGVSVLGSVLCSMEPSTQQRELLYNVFYSPLVDTFSEDLMGEVLLLFCCYSR